MARPLSAGARQKAIDATLALVFERGIDGFSVNEVATRSGVAKTTIYRHWPDPKLLLISALKLCVQSLPTPNTGSLHDDLVAFIQGALPVATQPGMRSVMLSLMAGAVVDPDVLAIHEQMLDERQNPVRTILQLAIGRGDLPTDLPIPLAVDFVEGPLFRRVVAQDEPVTDAEIEQLVAWTVAGLTGASTRGA